MEDNNNDDQPWGFVVYRTYYGDDELWEKTKTNLEVSRLQQADAIEEEEGNPDTATYVYLKDETQYKDKTPTEIRLIFNPYFQNQGKNLRDSSEPLPGLPDGYQSLCPHICLVLDKDAMESIAKGVDGYVIAVDAVDHLPNDNPPWDGTFKVSIDEVFAEFYLRAVGDNTLVMYEIRPKMGGIWNGNLSYVP